MKCSIRPAAAVCLLSLLAWSGMRVTAQSEETPSAVAIGPGERIVLLGGGLFERLQAHGFLETLLASRITESGVVVRNLGWSGDDVQGLARAVFGTAEDGFKRLTDDVRAANPTLILIGYGNNEAHHGPAGLSPFQQRLTRLLDELATTGARLVLVSPLPYEAKGPPFPDPSAYNTQLRLYAEVLRATAEQRMLTYLDLMDVDPRGWTRDGVQLTDQGTWFFAQVLAARLGYGPPSWRIECDASSRQYDAVNVAIHSLAIEGGQVRMTAQDRFLPAPAPPTPAAAGPRDAGVLRLTGLAAGRYQIFIDQLPIQVATAEQLAAGVSLVSRGSSAQVEQLRAVIREKNQLYFHRYRPQNETYLFLFRKHEQGNNAVEIPQFDPLIAAKEAQIGELKRPAPREIRVVRVDD